MKKSFDGINLEWPHGSCRGSEENEYLRLQNNTETQSYCKVCLILQGFRSAVGHSFCIALS